jgi:DNA invertase Pin-like site-specific DNA recombinase
MQLRDIREFCSRTDRQIVDTYVDRMTGSKDSRPELNRLMQDAAAGKFDCIVVWKFDRFARSAQHLLRALDEFKSHGIAFVSFTEGIDTGTIAGKLVFTVLAAVAEMERSVTIERIRAGIRNARAKGSKIGRPRAREFDIAAVRARIAAGEQRQHIAKSLRVSPALITKRLKGVQS